MTEKTKKEETTIPAKPKCGLIMPISALDEYTEQHWLDIRAILTDAINTAGFRANLVSDADDVGIIQKRIIQNLYDNPIVVCDVSGKNPNVMFELGIRLAFDKPTIIVKDEMTSYSFDTAPIEHLEYPRDLRFNKIVAFKNGLRDKIQGTHKKATEDKSYTTFLKHFGTFHVAQLETAEVSKEDFIIEELRDLKRMVVRSARRYQEHSIRDRERIRRPSVPSEGAMADMSEAFVSAVGHFSSEGREVVFPKMRSQVAEYIMENTRVARYFHSRHYFDECLDAVIRRQAKIS